MRLQRIAVKGFPPIENFEVDELSDLVVIAGANGAGKTRLINQILATIQNPRSQQAHFTIAATCDEEVEAFDGRLLRSEDQGAAIKFQQFLQQNRLRRNFKSGVVYFESDRSIAQIKPLAFSFEFSDPYTENIGWNVPMQPFKNRWEDTQHAIFKKIITLRNQLGGQAMKLGRDGKVVMNLGFSDPIQPFKDAFKKLLAPKVLIEPDLQQQRLMYREGQDERSIDTLSSGEREVLNIAFDFILRKPSDCVIFFDEPELHLHPELLGRLIKTLRSSGDRNQFILISHSPEVVSSSLDDTVIFLAKPKGGGANQATTLSPGGETTEALRALGQSVGVIALGKKVVLIEGTDASLDTKVYSTISRNLFPNLVMAPAEGKADIENFDRLNKKVLEKTLWGVDFFMLADRDCAVPHAIENERFQLLPRYHLENYFLDSYVLADCFEDQEDAGSWLRNPAEIEDRLRAIATEFTSYAAALMASSELRRLAGNVTMMPNSAHSLGKDALVAAAKATATNEVNRISSVLNLDTVEHKFASLHDSVQTQIASGDQWKMTVPGKPILRKFCADASIAVGRLKNLYITRALDADSRAFDDIIQIFQGFSDA